jgi:hypothetical protein
LVVPSVAVFWQARSESPNILLSRPTARFVSA